MERDSFIFYGSFFEALSCLEDEIRLQCYDAVIEYALTGNERELTGVPKAVFALIKPQIDANNERYVNGCKGGRPSSKTNGFEKIPNTKTNGFEKDDEVENQTITKHKPNENVNDNENDNDNENEKKATPSRKFIKPSVDDVRAYCEERQNGLDPEAFVDFYESKGWKVGNQPMKDWKSAVRTWERRSGNSKPQGKPPDNCEEKLGVSKEAYAKIHDFKGERTYDYDALMKEIRDV